MLREEGRREEVMVRIETAGIEKQQGAFRLAP